MEARRGYDSQGVLWSPGYFSGYLRPDSDVTLIASTEPWATIYALSPHEALPAEIERRERLLSTTAPAQTGFGAEMALASDQFIIIPAGRVEEAARARAAGDEVRTVTAGYPLVYRLGARHHSQPRRADARHGAVGRGRLDTPDFRSSRARRIDPEPVPGRRKGGALSHGRRDALVLHALDRYFQATSDRETLRLILPILRNIVSHHIHGTRFGIGVDPRDGLLSQGAAGYQLTWMDAKVGDWVVTPRRGKAVEINALWHNALRLLAEWMSEEDAGNDQEAEALVERAEKSANRSTAGSGTTRAATFTTSSTANAATTRPAARTSCCLSR